ncbi:Ethylene receptor 4 [Dichanthelium oligosanthes]|uniref:histidine kinase n=1 Tax=Dichanthelium oligosanthes TaxID=888268 RepID=A0A1E5W0Y6_9POAL|nr:Ethylene receptor 4 [Dichanthelium oligosanthes]
MAARCGGGCDGREDGAVEALLQWQKVSDFLIGASFLSIPLELLHFATCADLAPLRWVLLQFGAFTVLCGLVHLAAVLTYARPDSRRLLLAFTAAKALAALAASAAAVSLPAFIPQLLRLKTREALLRDKARQLDRDIALVRSRQETAARVVRAITHHVSRGGGGVGSLPQDAHAVLRAAVLHLSDALSLRSCAVWFPEAANDGSSVLHLVHQLPEDDHHCTMTRQAIRASDRDVASVMASRDAKVLRPGSALGMTSGHGAAAAIRMPMLRVSNFVDASSSGSDEQGAVVSYAIMVLVLPAPPPTPKKYRTRRQRVGGGGAREWSRQELEILEVVADQLAVALSHAAVLEEWQLTRYKLASRQRVLAQARHDAAAATRARDAAQGAMRDGVLRPMHSVMGLLSLMQAEQQDEASPCAEKRLAVDAMARISALSSTLTDDVMAAVLTPTTARGELASAAAAGVSLARRPFDLRALVRDAAAVAGCLARCRGLGFSHPAEMSSLPAECWVAGDDRRVFHLLLHMLGVVLDRCECHCHDLYFSVETMAGEQDPAMSADHRDWITPNFSGCNMVCVKFRFGITRILRDGLLHLSSPRPHDRIREGISTSSVSAETRLSITMCNKIVQMMNGKMWRESSLSDFGGQSGESMSLLLHFQLGYGVVSPSASSPSGAGFYRNVTRKLLERLGCQVLPVPSAAHCLSLLLGSDGTAAVADQPPFQFPCLQLQVVLLDLHTPTTTAGADAASAMEDGFEVALRIRELTSDSFSWLLILVSSAAACASGRR